MFGPSKDIDDINLLTRLQDVREMIEVGHRPLAEYQFRNRRHWNDTVTEVLELPGHAMAGAGGVCGEANNRDRAS
jgi:hypothetical protein